MDASRVALARRTVEVMTEGRVPDIVFRLSGTSSKRYGALGGEPSGIAGSMLPRIVRATGGEVVAIQPTGDAADGVLVSWRVAQQDAPSVAGAAAADRVSSVLVAA